MYFYAVDSFGFLLFVFVFFKFCQAIVFSLSMCFLFFKIITDKYAFPYIFVYTFGCKRLIF